MSRINRGLISSVFGAVFYTVSKHENHWSITYRTVPKIGPEKIKLIRGFRLMREAMRFADENLELSLIGEIETPQDIERAKQALERIYSNTNREVNHE